MDLSCRMPAYPLAVNDPYLSVWSAADDPTDANTTHWTGAEKPILIRAEYEGKGYRLMGLGEEPAAKLIGREVTPLRTLYTYEVPGAHLQVMFWSPALPQEPDLFSIPATFVEFSVRSTDGAMHEAAFTLQASDRFCYDGEEKPLLQAVELARFLGVEIK